MTGNSIDLRSLLPPVRNQGGRNTCIAFAATGAHSVLCGTPAPSLSVEYVHYHACKKRPVFNPHEGTSVSNMFDAVAEAGQPHDSMWPYLDVLPMDLSAYHPPVVPPALYRHSGELFNDFEAISIHLQKGIPVLLGLRLSTSFHLLSAMEILEFDPDPNPAGHHAVVAIGCRTVRSETVLVLRNSWGDGWADAGHGHVNETYLKPRITFMGAFRA